MSAPAVERCVRTQVLMKQETTTRYSAEKSNEKISAKCIDYDGTTYIICTWVHSDTKHRALPRSCIFKQHKNLCDT